MFKYLTYCLCMQFFVPYQSGNHYMLIVIDLINKSICYFDNVERLDSNRANAIAGGMVCHVLLILYMTFLCMS